jgi:hypothetical protein
MAKRFIITEEEKNDIKSLYNINEQESTTGDGSFLMKAFEKFMFPETTGSTGNPSSTTKPDDSSLPNKTTSDDDFYKGILKCLGAQPTKSNMLFMYAWRQSEGGGSANNPFNTTQKWPGATVLKNSSAGVKNYKTPEDGIQATCKTLQNGRYQSIIDGFKNDIGLSGLTDAVVKSPWGTKDLLRKVTQGYIAGNSPKPHPINPTAIA